MTPSSPSLLVLLAISAAGQVSTKNISGYARLGKFRANQHDWIDGQFTGHPRFACAIPGFPNGERFRSYNYKFFLKTPGVPKGLHCVLEGYKNDYKAMVESIGLVESPVVLRRGRQMPGLMALQAQCASRPRLLATLFDLLMVGGRPPHPESWCLLMRPTPMPHVTYGPHFAEPAGGALVLRFRDDKLPDMNCSPYRERVDDDRVVVRDSIDFFAKGFLEHVQSKFKCNFERNNGVAVLSAVPSAHTLVLRMVLGWRLSVSSVDDMGRPEVWFPVGDCREVCPANVPRPHDLVRQTGAYKDDDDFHFSVTSPTGRTARCIIPELKSDYLVGFDFEIIVIFPGYPRLVCNGRSIPLGQNVDGNDFYFIIFLTQDFNGARKLWCKAHIAERIIGNAIETTLLRMAKNLGLNVVYDSRELDRPVPSITVGDSRCQAAHPEGFLHYFEISGEFDPPIQRCAFGRKEEQPNLPGKDTKPLIRRVDSRFPVHVDVAENEVSRW